MRNYGGKPPTAVWEAQISKKNATLCGHGADSAEKCRNEVQAVAEKCRDVGHGLGREVPQYQPIEVYWLTIQVLLTTTVC